MDRGDWQWVKYRRDNIKKIYDLWYIYDIFSSRIDRADDEDDQIELAFFLENRIFPKMR